MSAMASQITGVATICFRHRSTKTSKLPVIGLCEGNPSVTDGSPSERAIKAENVSLDNVIMQHHPAIRGHSQSYGYQARTVQQSIIPQPSWPRCVARQRNTHCIYRRCLHCSEISVYFINLCPLSVVSLPNFGQVVNLDFNCLSTDKEDVFNPNVTVYFCPNWSGNKVHEAIYSHDEFRQLCLYFKDSKGGFVYTTSPKELRAMLIRIVFILY